MNWKRIDGKWVRTGTYAYSETSLNRLLNHHTENGYVIVSACLADWSDDELENRQMNNKMTNELKQDIYDSGYQYIPVSGGFIEEDGTEVRETSFIIVNYKNKNGNGEKVEGFDELKELAIDLCEKYNQMSVLVKEPNGKPTYYAKDGSVDFELSDKFTVRDAAQKYFTHLGGGKKFSFLQESEQLATINGVRSRRLKGEICEMYKTTETSRRQKARKMFLGGFKDIENFAIMTPENPMGSALSPLENRELCSDFEKELVDAKVIFHKVKGKFGGNSEHSYMLVNVPFELVRGFCSFDKYDQMSFFFCECHYDENNRNTGVTFNYWQRKAGKKNSFELIESTDDWVDVTNSRDNFTAIGKNFKFSLPLDIFSEDINGYSKCRLKFGDLGFETMLRESIHNKGFNAWADRAMLKKVVSENHMNANESSITRLIRHNDEHDCVCITAYRSNREKDEFGVHKRKARVSNQEANSALCAVLRKYGFNVTKVVGKYPEENGQSDVKENSWFVVNVNDEPDFVDVCADLAEADEQDSILVMPKGCFSNGKGCYLYGTNSNGNWPKYHEKKMTDGISVNGDSPFETRISGKLYSFNVVDESEDDTFWNPSSMFGAMARHAYIKNHYGLDFFKVRGRFMKKQNINETIDGSIKNIIQLKTLDQSLEYAQMFDALNDTPSEFQQKLIGALNSIGQTNDTDPIEAFNVVLCGNQDEDVKKKLYNWWRGFFEILSKCDIPNESKKEYDEKIDALIAEITKAGSSIDDLTEPNEVVSEEYEQASKEDEENMLKDMKFAISKIGEIANKVQDIINFVNPYCKKFNEDNEMKNIKNESNMSSLQNLAQDYAKGNIGKDILEDELYELFDGYDEKIKYGMEECESIRQSLMERVDAVNHLKGDSAYDNLIDWLIENAFFDDEDEAADWWSTSKLNIRRFKNESNDKQIDLGNEEVEVTYFIPDDMRDPGEKSLFTDRCKLKDISMYFDGQYNRVNVEVDGEDIKVFRTSSPGGYDYFKFDNPEDEEKFLEYASTFAEERKQRKELISRMYDMKYGKMNESDKTDDEEFDAHEKTIMSIKKEYLSKEKTQDEVIDMLFDIGMDADNIGELLSDWESDACMNERRPESKYDRETSKRNPWKDIPGEHDLFAMDIGVANGKDMMAKWKKNKYDEKSNDEWVSVDSLIGKDVVEEGTVEFKVGDRVIWIDSEMGEPESGWTIVDIKNENPDEVVYGIEHENGTRTNVDEGELEHDPTDEFEPDYHIGEHVIWCDSEGIYDSGWVVSDIRQTGDGIVYVINNPEEGSEAEVSENEIYLDDNYKVNESNGTLEHLAHKYQDKIGEAYGVLINFRDESSKYAPTCDYELDEAIKNLEVVKEWIDVGVEQGFEGVDFEDVSESEDNKEDEIKNTPKKFKNDNGSTSELVTGSKKCVSEMTIQQEIHDAEQLCEMLWGQGKSNLRELIDSKVASSDAIMSIVEDMMGGEVPTLTALNDLFAYDFAYILEPLGVDLERYNDTLEIVKMKDVELESTKVESTKVESTK